jgi:hypothetical protein
MPEPRSAEQRFVLLEVEAPCARCGARAKVHGLVLRTICNCTGAVELASPVWQELLTRIDRRSFERAPDDLAPELCEVNNPAGKLSARWRASSPSCDECGTDVPRVEPGTETSVTCTGCGRSVSTFPAPLWLRAELTTAMQIYGGARDDEHDSGRAVHHFWLSFQGTPPAVLEAQKQNLDRALNPHSVTPSTNVRVIVKRRGWRWEYLGIVLGLVFMGAAIHRCAAQLDDVPSEDVEPSP